MHGPRVLISLGLRMKAQGSGSLFIGKLFKQKRGYIKCRKRKKASGSSGHLSKPTNISKIKEIGGGFGSDSI